VENERHIRGVIDEMKKFHQEHYGIHFSDSFVVVWSPGHPRFIAAKPFS
jgi:hypothetical protein